jgi:tetratricopeptide (TPR) repeat protein
MRLAHGAAAFAWLTVAVCMSSVAIAADDGKKPAATLDAKVAMLEERLQTEPAVAVLRDAMQLLREQSQDVDKRHLDIVDDWFDDALKAEPTSVPLRMILAEFREIQGRTDDSIKLYQELLKDKSIGKLPRAVVNNNLAFALAVRGSDKDLAEAATAIGDAIGELGLTVDLLDTRASVRLAKKDLKGAREDLKSAIKQQPNGVLYFHLALVEEKAQDRQAMLAAMRQSLELKVDRNQIPPGERKSFDRMKAEVDLKK